MVALLVLDGGRYSIEEWSLTVLYECTRGGGSPFQLGPTGEGRMLVDQFDLYSPTADSINALSKASLMLPIEPADLPSRSASVNAIDVYWLPASERCTNQSR